MNQWERKEFESMGEITDFLTMLGDRADTAKVVVVKTNNQPGWYFWVWYRAAHSETP